MIEVILLAIITGQLGLIAWIEYNGRKERKALIDRIIAKNNQELVNLDLADKTVVKKENKPTIQEDLTEVSQMPDDDFFTKLGIKK